MYCVHCGQPMRDHDPEKCQTMAICECEEHQKLNKVIEIIKEYKKTRQKFLERILEELLC